MLQRTRLAALTLWLFTSAGILASAGAAGAEPMQLADPSPRWVGVAFEVSPSDQPGQLNTLYTPRIPARLEPAGEHLVRVSVSGRLVERHLLRDHDPRPGSVSDFVWLFDRRTGQVQSASLHGVLRQEASWGPFRKRLDTEIEVRLDTLAPAGFRPARVLLGHPIFRSCASSADGECRVIEPKPYDVATGYVNAVGSLAVDARVAAVRSFCPLGEAIFSELAAAELASLVETPVAAPASPPAVASGPPATLPTLR